MDPLGIPSLAWRVGQAALAAPRPFLLYFKPTARCDLRCEICNRWRDAATEGQELGLDRIARMLSGFRRAGSVVLTLWGGEPMLRRDLHEILSEAKRQGYRTSMCTNCNTLERRSGQVLPHLDSLLCSLDGFGDLHDEIRGVRGLFRRVVRGIEAAKRFPGCDIKIWATVHRKNAHQLGKLARLARELDVWIEFFPVAPIAGYNSDLVLRGKDLEAAFDDVIDLADAGYPVRNPARALEIMRSDGRFECNFGRIAMHVDHAGNVYSCEDPAGRPLFPWGTLDEIDLPALIASREYGVVANSLTRCGRCRLPCVIELSGDLPLALAWMMQKFVDNAI